MKLTKKLLSVVSVILVLILIIFSGCSKQEIISSENPVIIPDTSSDNQNANDDINQIDEEIGEEIHYAYAQDDYVEIGELI